MSISNLNMKSLVCRVQSDIPPDVADPSRPIEMLCLNAEKEGNIARFFNHSCASNMDKQTILTVNCGSTVVHCIGLFATKAEGIPAGEELTYYYKWNNRDSDPCNCGALNCSGRLHLGGGDAGPAS
jgi:hypothetical protein